MLTGHTAISGDHARGDWAILAVRSGLASTEVQPTGRGPYIPRVFCPDLVPEIASLFRFGLSGSRSLLRL
jgi:hypothetical protein